MQKSQSWADKNYSIVKTEDGSPSLHWKLNAEAAGEMMHHRGGALAETEQIYGEVVRQALGLQARHFCSVGLGLGYNEMMIARDILRTNTPISEIRVTSYESDPFLVESFLFFLKNPAVISEINSIYQNIINLMAPAEIKQITELLLKLKEEGHWKISGALSAEVVAASMQSPSALYDVVLYDAFSSKTSPELWNEEFLNLFLEKMMSQKCFFSTYACTGPLKRSLKAHGFEVILREGFHGKRNSTLGRRG